MQDTHHLNLGRSPLFLQRPYTQLRIRAFCPGIFAFLAVFRVVVFLATATLASTKKARRLCA